MCLYSVDRRPYPTIKQGYKVMQKVDGDLYFPVRDDNKIVPTNMWLNEYDYRKHKETATLLNYGLAYPTGFHIFSEMDGAFRFILYETTSRLRHPPMLLEIWLVDVEDIPVIGHTSFGKTFVTRKMRLRTRITDERVVMKLYKSSSPHKYERYLYYAKRRKVSEL